MKTHFDSIPYSPLLLMSNSPKSQAANNIIQYISLLENNPIE